MKTYLKKSELWPNKLPNNVINRVNGTIKTLEEAGLHGSIADCGESNPMKKAIEKYFDIQIDSIDWDFNWKCNLRKRYDVILCFEVLEHVMNSLLFLNELKKLLKPNGIIYLSTPYQRPQLLKAIHHYHEIPTDRLMWLFKEAGFTIEHLKNITIAGNLKNHIKGFRPILRYFQKTRMHKLYTKEK